MISLSALFCTLATPAPDEASATVFSGANIAETKHHLGKDSRGRPAILLNVSAAKLRPASTILKNLRVEHGLHCRISTPVGLIDGEFSLLHCQSDSELLQNCFFELSEVLLRSLSAQPDAGEVSRIVERMAALFLAIDRPPTRAVQGLWGELLMICHAQHVIIAVEAWHTDACDHYDFAHGLFRLEVKTSGDRSRNHHFSYEQVYGADDVDVTIASMFVESSAAGRKLGELWDTVRSAVAAEADLRVKVDEICLQTLGATWQDARSLAYDDSLALDSLAYFAANQIPRVPRALPIGVSEVKFRSDLAFGAPLEFSRKRLNPLLEALVLL
jgi:putative PD-(D/E)XK family protein DUF4420